MRDLGKIWLYVADTSCRGYSPLYDRICRTVAESDEVLDLVSEAPPVGHNPVLLLAAVHYLLLGGLDHPLAAVYAGESDADPGPLFVDVCLQHRDVMLELLATQQVNTNEVGRSAVIGPALTAVASRLSAPLGLVDVGCSAGLNLLCDRYRLDYGSAGATGPARRARADPLRDRRWVAADRARASGDRGTHRPRPRAGRRARSGPVEMAAGVCVARHRTARANQARARGGPARSRSPWCEGDAVEGVGAVIESLPLDATAVVMTTWVVAYFSPEQRAGFRERLAAASASRPVAWISAEAHGVVDLIPSEGVPSDTGGMEWSVLGLVIFRNGEPEPSCSAACTRTGASSTGDSRDAGSFRLFAPVVGQARRASSTPSVVRWSTSLVRVSRAQARLTTGRPSVRSSPSARLAGQTHPRRGGDEDSGMSTRSSTKRRRMDTFSAGIGRSSR